MQSISIRERFARISDKLNRPGATYSELEFVERGFKVENLSSRISALEDKVADYGKQNKKK